MVFFTSVIIVVVLYYLQADGLIYVTIIAVIAEVINLFMTQAITRSVEQQMNWKYGKVIKRYKQKLIGQKKTIKEYMDIQDESINKLRNANLKIKEYEEKSLAKKNIDIKTDRKKNIPANANWVETKIVQPSHTLDDSQSKKKSFSDLPPGSNRKQLPI